MPEPKEDQQSIIVLAGIVTVLAAVLLYVLGPSLVPASLSVQGTKVYFADRISAAHRKIIDRFNELHRGRIEVVPVDLPFDKFSTNERKELLARSLRSKSDKLDIFSVDLIWVERFARWCEPLDPYFPSERRNELLPLALESCFQESSLVAAPLHLDIGLLYYRKDILRGLPDGPDIEARLAESISWPEFLRLRDRLNYRGKPFYVFQADEYEGLVCTYLELVRGLDSTAVSTAGINLEGAAARNALQMLVDFVHKDRISPARVTEMDEPRSYTYMLDSNAVFVRGWPNFVEDYRSKYPDTSKLAMVGKAAMPHFSGQAPTSVFGGWNLMVSKFSRRKAEAVEFLRYAQTKEAQQILFETEGFLPVTRAVYDDATFMRAHPGLAYYQKLLARGFHRPSLVDYTRISDVLSHFVRRAILAEMTVDESLRQASVMIRANRAQLH